MKCDRVTELIAASVMDGLPAHDRDGFERHVAKCESCAAEVKMSDVLWGDLARAATPQPEAYGLRRFQEALREFDTGQENPERPARTSTHGRWTLGIAAALLLVVVGAMGGITLERTRVAQVADAVVGPRFLLLMRGIDFAAESDSTVNSAVGAWADGLFDEQRLVEGGAIDSGPGAWLGLTPNTFELSGEYALDGYMIIRARDLAEARATASQAPHLMAGGAVELWPVR